MPLERGQRQSFIWGITDMLKTKNYIFESDYCVTISSPTRMYLRVLNASLADVAKAFGDRNETAQIIVNGTSYEGYTSLVAISVEGNAYKVILGR